MSETGNDEASFDVEGHAVHLDGDKRYVWVGQRPGDSTVFVLCVNEDSSLKFKLSFEGATALRALLGRVSERGLMAEAVWELAAEPLS